MANFAYREEENFVFRIWFDFSFGRLKKGSIDRVTGVVKGEKSYWKRVVD